MLNNPDKRNYISGLSKTGLFHLLVIYFVWSTTYLAIRIAVREGGGFPPFTFGAMRTLIAGLILLIWNRLKGTKLDLTREDFITFLVSGLLLWVGGNGMVIWAEQKAHSGYAALIIGSIPIWVVIIESFIKQKAPDRRILSSIFLGFIGLFVLSLPSLLSGYEIDYLSFIALLIGSICWGLGSVFQKYRMIKTDPTISSAYQQLFGGIGFTLLALFFKEPIPSPSTEAWISWLYLVIFGSIFAFTSFVMALKLLPISLVMTYAYVNPVIALILGWLILKEPISLFTIIGAFFIIFSIYRIFYFQSRKSNVS